MTRLAETPHCVNNIASPKLADRIRERLDLPNDQLAALLGARVEYVRAIRSRHHRKRMGLPPPPSDLRRRSRATGQPRDELHELAQTLYRWRQEGRFEQ